LWSTRRRKELTNEKEDYTFAQIGRVISDEWKKVEGEPLEKLKEEAERLNFEGVKKLPKEGGGGSDSDSGSSAYSEDEDPSFKKGKKPITLKIKREASTRESRSRKRPSFFQEYENEEDNLDKILDEFEQEQIMEQRKPREAKPKAPKNPGSRPRKRKPEPSYQEDDGDVELETSRSGRVRKIRRRKVFAFGDEDNEDSGSDGGDRDEYQPDSGEEKVASESEESNSGDSENENDNDENGYKLPLKKRKPGQPMTKEDIERAKKAAFAAKPQIVVDSKKLKKKDYRDEIDSIIKPGEEDYADFSDDELSQVLKMHKPAASKARVEVAASDDEDAAGSDKAASPVPDDDVSLNTPKSNRDAGDGSDAENNENRPEAETNNSNKEISGGVGAEEDISGDIEEGGDLEGSVTAESPVQNFDSDDDENIENDTMDKSVPVNGSHETGTSAEEQTGGGSSKPILKETSAEDDFLTSTEATSMEEGDEQYKNMIAETQMENIFN